MKKGGWRLTSSPIDTRLIDKVQWIHQQISTPEPLTYVEIEKTLQDYEINKYTTIAECNKRSLFVILCESYAITGINTTLIMITGLYYIFVVFYLLWINP